MSSTTTTTKMESTPDVWVYTHVHNHRHIIIVSDGTDDEMQPLPSTAYAARAVSCSTIVSEEPEENRNQARPIPGNRAMCRTARTLRTRNTSVSPPRSRRCITTLSTSPFNMESYPREGEGPPESVVDRTTHLPQTATQRQVVTERGGNTCSSHRTKPCQIDIGTKLHRLSLNHFV
ncbi:hypothetical protein BO99DRAFT_252372 [Aspergillus violaceofuscus CBS 115571]|uniref:Uncharacterized protein n=1 Tax=Aspergillus violaceofuscus (strain CBS 115571) TaxID=1450538 RepID=A0A2V5I740_ASPV1|nr:hypothetical protein BO99DRAFT_252372 [Aspergillus violaceofuscus CBS 115571]